MGFFVYVKERRLSHRRTGKTDTGHEMRIIKNQGE